MENSRHRHNHLSGYVIASKALVQNTEKATSLAEIRKLFKDFAKKYTVTPELWEKWLQ